MKLLSRFAPYLAFLLLLGCAQDPSKPFAPANSGFSVQMPGNVDEQTTELGGHIYTSQVGDNAYIVSYSDLSGRVKVTRANAQQVLDNARNGATSEAGNKLLSEKHVTLEGNPARDLRLKTKSGYYMRLRIALAGSTLYQVGVVTDMSKADQPEIDKFISTFHFTAK